MRRRGEWSELAIAAAVIAGAAALAVTVGRGAMPRASGIVGHGLGVAGYLIMLWAAFGYTWRKNVRHHGPGSAERWLRTHVIAGLVGPGLILLHTGFAFRGLAGATTLLLMIVVLSGVAGRYVYTRLPRHIAVTDHKELERIDEEIAALEREMSAIDAHDAEPDALPGGAATMTAPPRRVDAAAVEAQLRTLRRLRAHHARRTGGAGSSHRARRMIALWWVLHVPVSLAMLVLGLVHALAALWYATLSP